MVIFIVVHLPYSKYLFLDDGKVLKVVSIPKENQESEEIILEELSVFQVTQFCHTIFTQSYTFPLVSSCPLLTCNMIFSCRMYLVTIPAKAHLPQQTCRFPKVLWAN